MSAHLHIPQAVIQQIQGGAPAVNLHSCPPAQAKQV